MKAKDFVTPERWKSFIIYLIKRLLRSLGETETYLERHEIEQYAYRLFTCPDCVEAGKCIGHYEGEEPCGCDTIGRMNNKKDHCSIKKWGMFQDKEEWEQTKEYLGISKLKDWIKLFK